MHYAHEIYWSGVAGNSWKQAMICGWDAAYLREYLTHGVAEFTFIKQDGTERTARGTLNADIIPPSKAPTGKQQAMIDAGLAKQNYKSISYYDLDKETWRSFSVENLLSVNRVLYMHDVVC